MTNEPDPSEAEIIDNTYFNEARGRKMYERGEPEPASVKNNIISMALVMGWNKARLEKLEKERKKSRHSSVTVNPDDYYRYPCDDE